VARIPPPPRPPRASSPCIGICTIEPSSPYCIGCKRTLKEIARWGVIDEAERLKIMDELPNRGLGPG